MSKFTKLRSITLAQLKLELGVARNLAILNPMYKGEQIDDKKEAATLFRAVDMETGEEGLVIAPTILVKELNDNFPGESYVGRGFEIIKTRDPEKKYNHIGLSEISIPEDMQASIDALRKVQTKASGANAAPVKTAPRKSAATA